ncbi:MAG: CHAT domain-containing protein, partial [Candidatus Aminicenantes bacterium]
MKPIIILAFANDNDAYLPMIVRERKNIFKTLQNYHDKGFVQVHKEESTSIADIFALFNRYSDRIAIFHYGGHANGTHLQLESCEGESQLADAKGLAQLMGQQKDLQLVFLNGCATRKQVDILLSCGVKAVIATSVPIDDKMATEFAEQFYNALASQATLKKAFQIAKAFIMSKYGPSKAINLYSSRDISWQGKEEAAKEEVPWGLYRNENAPEVLDWKLPISIDLTPEDKKSFPRGGIDPFNFNLVKVLLNEAVLYSNDLKKCKQELEENKLENYPTIQRDVHDIFPTPIGGHLKTLFQYRDKNDL